MTPWPLIACLLIIPVRDDGRYAQSPNKAWMDGLKNRHGQPCCSDADGILDPEWESGGGKYRVKLDGNWIAVPPEAVITEPNRIGRAMVWPLNGYSGTTIRCFIPGALI